MNKLLKLLSLPTLLMGLQGGAAVAQTLAPPDIYLSVVEKEALLPTGEVAAVAVTIGNGVVSRPTPPAQLNITLEAPLARSIAAGDPIWWQATRAGVTCDPMPVIAAGSTAPVTVSCSIPGLTTGETFDLSLSLLGQEPWSQYRVDFAIDPLMDGGIAVDPNPDNQAEYLVVTSVEVADLSLQTRVSKDGVVLNTAQPGSPVRVEAKGGETYDFTATVTNHGPQTANGFYVTIPRQPGFSSYILPAGCVSEALDSGAAYTCRINESLAPGQTWDLSYSAELMSPVAAGGSSETSVPLLNFVGSIQTGRLPRDIDFENNSVEMSFSVGQGGDIGIAKTLTSASTVVEGELISYTITPNYIGTNPGSVIIRDVLPEGLEFVSNTGDGTCAFAPATRVLSCTVPVTDTAETSDTRKDIAAIGVDLRVLSDSGLQEFTNEARVELPAGKPVALYNTNTTNDTATATTVTVEVPRYELAVTKNRRVTSSAEDAHFAVVGDTVRYTIAAKNDGNVALNDRILITENLPAGLAWRPSTAGDWTCETEAQPGPGGLIEGPATLLCTYQITTPLRPGASAPPLEIETRLVSLAGATENGDGADMLRNNVQSSATIWNGPDAPAPGDNVPSFNGPDASHDLVVSEDLNSADLGVFKARSVPALATGDWQTYSLTVVNHGARLPGDGSYVPSIAREVTVTDELSNLYTAWAEGPDAPIRILDDAGATCTISARGSFGATLTCTYAALPTCATQTSGVWDYSSCGVITLEVRQGGIPGAWQGQQSNTARVASPVTPDPDYSNNEPAQPVTHTVAPKFALAVTKVSNQLTTDPNAAFKVGERFRYTLTVRNVPPEDGSNDRTAAPVFKLRDTLPRGIRVHSITSGAASVQCGAVNAATPSDAPWFECSIPEGLAVGDQRTITIEAEGNLELVRDIVASPDQSIMLRNDVAIVFDGTAGDAEVASPGQTSPTADNEAFANVRMVQGEYDLAITKTVVQAYLNAGDMATFRLRVSNVGQVRAENAVVLEGLPPADFFEFASARVEGRPDVAACALSPTPGYSEEYTNQAGTDYTPRGSGVLARCSIGDVEPEETVTLLVTGRLLKAGSYRNYTSVTADKDQSQDDYNYRNNFSDTSITAQELVDLSFVKSVKPPASGDRYASSEVITFALNVQNIARLPRQGPEDDRNDLRYYYTDASRVRVSDRLPTGLIYNGTVRSYIDDVLQTPGLCAAPGQGTTVYSCEVPQLRNGAALRVELDTTYNGSCSAGVTCRTDGSLTNTNGVTVNNEVQYAEMRNTAGVTTTSSQPVPNSPDDGSVTVGVLLSSISGHYWWDLENNGLDPTSPALWAYSQAEGDEMIPGRSLSLQVQDGSGWQTVETTLTDSNGFYKFDYLPAGTYRIVDNTSFNADQVTDVGGRKGVLGALTLGSEVGDSSSDDGSVRNLHNGSSREFTSINLGSDKHGVNYDLRIVPVPSIGLDKAIAGNASTLTPALNGTLRVNYVLRVTNTSMETLTNVELRDALSTNFGTNSAALNTLAAGTPAQILAARNLGNTLSYGVAASQITAMVGSTALTVNAGYTGVAGSSDLLLSGVEIPEGATAVITVPVLVSLGQPLASPLPTTFDNIATVKGVGKSTGFTSDGATDRPVQSNGQRTTPELAKTDDAAFGVTLTSGIKLAKTLVPRDKLQTPVGPGGRPYYDGKLVYQFTIRNTGNLPLSEVVLTDARLGVSPTNMTALFTDLNNEAGSKLGADGLGALFPVPGLLYPDDPVVTVYGVYTLTSAEQRALADGRLDLDNTATVNADGHVPVDDTSSASSSNSLTFEKTARVLRLGASSPVNDLRVTQAGDQILYGFTVTNTGDFDFVNGAITDAKIIDSLNAASPGSASALTGLNIAAGETLDLPASYTYTVTQNDIDAIAAGAENSALLVPSATSDNLLVNNAVLTGEFHPGVPVEMEDDVTVNVPRLGGVEITKYFQTDFAEAKPYAGTDTIRYALVVENTGSTLLQEVTLTDTALGINGLRVAAPYDRLRPGQKLLVHGPDYDLTTLPAGFDPTGAVPDLIYSTELPALNALVTAEQIAAGTVRNTASVTGTTPGGGSPTDSSTVDTPLEADPKIVIEKSVTPETGLTFDANGVASPVTYSFLVRNTGNVPLRDIVVRDELLNYEYDLSPALMAANGSPELAAGASYPLTLTNYRYAFDPSGTGRNHLELAHTDYQTLVAAVATGTIVNKASVNSTHNGTPVPVAEDEAEVTTVNTPAFVLTKTAGAVSADGKTLTWTITLRNTGPVVLDNVLIEDTRLAGRTSTDGETVFNAAGEFTLASLNPQQSYVITVADDVTTLGERDLGTAENSVTATYTPPTGTPVTETVTTPVKLHATSGIVIMKDRTDLSLTSGVAVAGQSTITWDFYIRNEGSVGLSDLTFSDPSIGVSATAAGTVTTPSYLPPGFEADIVLDLDLRLLRYLPPHADYATWVASQPDPASWPAADATGLIRLGSITWPLLQAWVDAGEHTNIAAITGDTPPRLTDVNDDPLPETVTDDDDADAPFGPAPAFTAVKTGALADTAKPTALGDRLNWAFAITNTGNVTLGGPANPFVITETLALEGFTWGQNAATLGSGAAGVFTLEPLAPGQSVTINAHSLVTTADLLAGEVINTATVTSEHGGTPVDTPVTSTVELVYIPGISLEKTYCPVISCGNTSDKMRFSLVIRNSGNAVLDTITLTELAAELVLVEAGDFDPATDTISADGVTFTRTAPVAPGESFTLYADYTLVTDEEFEDGTYSAADLAYMNAGEVTNTAQVTGDSHHPSTQDPLPQVTDTDDATGPLDQEPKVTLDKTVMLLPEVAGVTTLNQATLTSVVSYQLVVTNIGNVTLTNLVVEDPRLAFVRTIATLAPGESVDLATLADVTAADLQTSPTQSELDARALLNTASVRVPHNGTDYEDDDSTTTVLVPAPGFTVSKTGALDTPTVTTAVGHRVNWAIEVTNTGNVWLGMERNGSFDPFMITELATLDGFAWGPNDPALGSGNGLEFTLAPLAPGASVTIQASSLVTAADLVAGQVTNLAQVTSQHGSDPVIDEDSTSTVPLLYTPDISLEKTYCAPGTCGGTADKMRFSLVVTNTGNAVLDTITLTELAAELALVEAGDFDPATDTISADGVTFTRTAPVAPGESFTLYADYTLVTDEEFAAGTYSADDLAYMNAGEVTNTARVIGDSHHPSTQDPLPQVTDTDDATGPLLQEPSVQLEKTVMSPAEVGGVSTVDPADLTSVISYQLVVTNTGNVTLTNLVVEDPRLAFVRTIATLAPGESVDLATLADVTAADLQTSPTQSELDARALLNTASVRVPHNGTDYEDDDSTTTVLVPAPGFTVSKTGALDTPTVTTAVGHRVNWAIEVTNTGNVWLGMERNGSFDPFLITELATLDGFAWGPNDPALGSGNGLEFTLAPLAPGASITIQASSLVTAADLVAGQVTNLAQVTSQHGSDPVIDEDSTSTVPLLYTPDISLEKTYCAPGTCGGTADKMRFSLVVTNTGNAVLDTITLTELAAELALVEAGDFDPATDTISADGVTFTRTAPVAPGESFTLYADYTLVTDEEFAAGTYSADDLAYMNAGEVTNTARVIGDSHHPSTQDPLPQVTDTDDATGPLDQEPSVQLEKTVMSPAEVGGVSTVDPADLTSVISYQLVVTNTGNVTLTNLVVEDPRLAFVRTIAALAPGASINLATLADVTAADLETSPTQGELDSGELLNTATVTTTHNGRDITDRDEVETVLVPEAAITLLKEVSARDETKAAVAGEVVTYSFTITNTGDRRLDPVVLKDDFFGPGWSQEVAGGLDALGSTVITVDYALTQSDVERGWIFNKATVEGSYPGPDGTPVPVQAEDEVIVQYFATPELSLIKTADDSQLTTPPAVGQEINYSFTVQNIGSVTAHDLRLSDVLDVDFVGGDTLAELPAGETHVFRAVYALTQEDLDRGSVVNTALISSSFMPDPDLPTGYIAVPPTVIEEVRSQPDSTREPGPTVTPLIMRGEFTAQKSANLETVYLGDSVTYTLTFESQSSGLVRDMHFVDRLPAGLVYTPDSAMLSVGTAAAIAAEPVVSGRRLTWGPVDVPRRGTVTITFRARVSAQAPYGKLTNDTWSETGEGEKNSNTGSATVYRQPEHVFECSDVTGKVFEDFNHNGRQDPLDRTGLTNDDIYTGKFGKYETLPKEPRGEMGLPHVRLVTPTGTVITTDAHGRFSVPCAELPRDLGSNFTLKLDTRSLPTGYRVTTENPRTLRLTAGKAAQMNFGAAMSKLISLDLGSAAFVAGRADPGPALTAALRDFAAAAVDEPVVIRLSYVLAAGESRAMANQRLDAVEELVVRHWAGRRANLIMERNLTVSAE